MFATSKSAKPHQLERTGWLRSNREAHLILLTLLTAPAAPQRNGPIILRAQPPRLGKAGNVAHDQLVPSP